MGRVWQNSVLLSGRQLKTALFPLTLPTSCYQVAPSTTARLYRATTHTHKHTYLLLCSCDRAVSRAHKGRTLLPCFSVYLGEEMFIRRERGFCRSSHSSFRLPSYLGYSPALLLPICFKLMVLSRGFTLYLRHSTAKHTGGVHGVALTQACSCLSLRTHPRLVFTGI